MQALSCIGTYSIPQQKACNSFPTSHDGTWARLLMPPSLPLNVTHAAKLQSCLKSFLKRSDADDQYLFSLIEELKRCPCFRPGQLILLAIFTKGSRWNYKLSFQLKMSHLALFISVILLLCCGKSTHTVCLLIWPYCKPIICILCQMSSFWMNIYFILMNELQMQLLIIFMINSFVDNFLIILLTI